MNNERKLLNSEKAKYKEQLTSLKHYMRELKERCAECKTLKEHSTPALMKVKNDVQFYQGQIKEINNRLRKRKDE